ncbi:MAG: hypothetical protein AAF439_07125 [Pseudomonadota bacterium]
MRITLAIAAAIFAAGTIAHADDATPAPSPNGHTIGHDGKMWRMEGCAAYPVTAETKTEPASDLLAKMGGKKKPQQLAQSTPVEE